MLKFIQELQQELNETGLGSVFEFEVTDTITGEKDYILCNVFFNRKSIVCHRAGLTIAEQNSRFIASDRVVAYKGDNLHELLESLHEEIYYSIINSPLYNHV